MAELEKGDLQGATERVDGLLQRAPDFAAARRERAWIYLRSGDAAAAVEAMNTALAHAPADGTGHYEQGLLFLEIGRPLEALGAFNAALERNPSLVDAHLGAAQVHYQRSEYQHARNHWERCLDLSPGHPGASQSLAVLDGEGR